MPIDKFPYEFNDITSDVPEKLENRKHTHSMEMLRKIIADLDPTDFTIEEIIGNFNAGTPLKQDINTKDNPPFIVVQIRYGQTDIDYLAKKGFIESIEAGHYMVTPKGEIAGGRETEKDFEDTDELISPHTTE